MGRDSARLGLSTGSDFGTLTDLADDQGSQGK
jgi:hypothetical protein